MLLERKCAKADNCDNQKIMEKRMVIKLMFTEYYACIWARSLVLVKLQTTL